MCGSTTLHVVTERSGTLDRQVALAKLPFDLGELGEPPQGDAVHDNLVALNAVVLRIAGRQGVGQPRGGERSGWRGLARRAVGQVNGNSVPDAASRLS